MKDGHLNKCKECTKNDIHKKYLENRNDSKFIEKERKRCRDKYYRLNYSLVKPKKEVKSKSMLNYYNSYPEKMAAKIFLGKKIKSENGIHKHHWSYNKEHFLDIIELTIKQHNIAHRYLIYDKERFMYRTTDNILLDTKESHLYYIMNKISTEC
jgi:hypothetical protein